MKLLYLIPLLFLTSVFGDTVTQNPWDLYDGTTIIGNDVGTEQQCVDLALTQEAGTYGCRTITHITVDPVVIPPDPPLGNAFNYVGIPYPTYTNPQLQALGYVAWPYDPATLQPPALPTAWDANQTGFFYVKAGGTNSGNGFPASPRATIPTSPQAGDVVVISGDISTGNLSVPVTINAGCTSVAPCFFVGVDNARLIAHYYNVNGSHLIIDNVDAYQAGGSGTAINIGGSFVTVRNGDYSNATGVSRQAFGFGGSNIFFYKNTVHNIGNWNSATDDNRHGIKVSNASNWWVIDNVFRDITNDGLQCGDTNTPNTKLGFVAGNEAYNNAQNGFWTKNCYDVVFSTNIVHDHIDHPAGAGGYSMLGGQYDFANVWWLNNYGYGVGGALAIASNNGTQTQGPRYAIGNKFENLENPAYDPTNSHSNAAILDRNSSWPLITVNNKIINSHAGFSSPYGARNIYCNVFDAVTAPNAAQLFLYSPGASTIDYNAYSGAATVKYNNANTGGFSLLTSAGHESHGAQNAALEFLDCPLHPAYTEFLNRYGFSIEELAN